MARKTAGQFDQKIIDLYDDYAHGRLLRRDYLKQLAVFAVGGLTIEALEQSLAPNYALAEEVASDDPRIVAETVTYNSPEGGGKISGLLAYPANASDKKFPTVLVIHENRGLNPYIADVARRLAVEGFLAFAPDALSPLGGYPGNDDEGRAMQGKRDRDEMTQDFIAAAKLLKTHKLATGKVGAVGFCFGGGMVNQLAVRIPETLDAGVPFYGSQPTKQDVSKIETPLCIHNAELDGRILSGADEFDQALTANNVPHESFVYPGVNHGFHNDTTPRYDEAAAKLAWRRTLDWFKKYLG